VIIAVEHVHTRSAEGLSHIVGKTAAFLDVKRIEVKRDDAGRYTWEALGDLGALLQGNNECPEGAVAPPSMN